MASPNALTCLRKLGLGQWILENDFQQPSSLVLCFPADQYTRVKRNPELPDLGMVIPRVKLDHVVLEHAMKKGARFLEETKATDAVIDDQGVSVKRLNNGHQFSIHAQMVLAGDGSIASFSRRIGMVQKAPEVVAVRTYVQGEKQDVDSYHVFFLHKFLPGYSWIFPVGPGLFNVGLGLRAAKVKKKGVSLKATLDDFLSSHYAEQVMGRHEVVAPVRGHPLRTWGVNRAQLSARRVLAMGDAASLAHPLSGEGIAPALESGLLAAEHTLRALEAGDFSRESLSAYAGEIRKRYERDYRAAWILREIMAVPALAKGVGYLGKNEPEFALMSAKAVLAQSSGHLLNPISFLKGFVYWPIRTMMKRRLPMKGLD